MLEKLYEYTNGYQDYELDRITENGQCTILLRNLNKKPYGVLSYIKYKDVGEELNSPFINWFNLFFCSNNYGIAPDHDYMNIAVQNGTKTTATIYIGNDEYKRIVRELPSGVSCVPYFIDGGRISVAYIFRDGTLSDYFDFEKVKSIYNKHGIADISWEVVREEFSRPMEDFSDESKCGFNIQHGSSRPEVAIILGLLLGYPVESTVAFLNGTIEVFGGNSSNKIRSHFRKSDEDITDDFHVLWHKSKGVIYREGQQESLYGILYED